MNLAKAGDRQAFCSYWQWHHQSVTVSILITHLQENWEHCFNSCSLLLSFGPTGRFSRDSLTKKLRVVWSSITSQSTPPGKRRPETSPSPRWTMQSLGLCWILAPEHHPISTSAVLVLQFESAYQFIFYQNDFFSCERNLILKNEEIKNCIWKLFLHNP